MLDKEMKKFVLNIDNISKYKYSIDIIYLLIIFSVSIIIAYNYFFLVDFHNLAAREDLHDSIIGKNAGDPYLYRILVPYLAEIFIKFLSQFIPHDIAFLLSYGIYDVIAIFLIAATLFVYLNIWFSKEYSLIGALYTLGMMPIALTDHYYQPWSLLEVVFFTTSLLLIYKKKVCV